MKTGKFLLKNNDELFRLREYLIILNDQLSEDIAYLYANTNLSALEKQEYRHAQAVLKKILKTIEIELS